MLDEAPSGVSPCRLCDACSEEEGGKMKVLHGYLTNSSSTEATIIGWALDGVIDQKFIESITEEIDFGCYPVGFSIVLMQTNDKACAGMELGVIGKGMVEELKEKIEETFKKDGPKTLAWLADYLITPPKVITFSSGNEGHGLCSEVEIEAERVEDWGKWAKELLKTHGIVVKKENEEEFYSEFTRAIKTLVESDPTSLHIILWFESGLVRHEAKITCSVEEGKKVIVVTAPDTKATFATGEPEKLAKKVFASLEGSYGSADPVCFYTLCSSTGSAKGC